MKHRARAWAAPVFALLVALAVYARAAGNPVVGKLQWLGQSCFILETTAGTRVVMDPIPKGLGYELPAGLKADVVTISHEHQDHNNLGLLVNKPRVLRGLTPDKKGWTKIDLTIKDVTIRSVGVYHDDAMGAERGLNTVFVFEVGGLRIAHLGDLGHLLTDDQLSAIGSVDVVLIPVGGVFTIDGRQATRVVDQLRPRLVVIPMHYKTDVLTIKQLEGVDDFLAGKPNVRKDPSNTLSLSTVKARPAAEIVVLNYK
ncbi:MAG TPA: MBL fold metallo-hydrolase [Polyangia bacterium]|jgi:L-ascorbate metabolism protein UlaG (beta-lactamase superfamily)|nr:MBL fold metallo-hydrolase [Polyangia bacterium]